MCYMSGVGACLAWHCMLCVVVCVLCTLCVCVCAYGIKTKVKAKD